MYCMYCNNSFKMHTYTQVVQLSSFQYNIKYFHPSSFIHFMNVSFVYVSAMLKLFTSQLSFVYCISNVEVIYFAIVVCLLYRQLLKLFTLRLLFVYCISNVEVTYFEFELIFHLLPV